eukprot:6793549-Alexandrium_andersonii.AAC.1
MRARAAVIWCKGDWMEFSQRFGLPSHASGLRPCYCCNTPGGTEALSPVGITVHGGPWTDNVDSDFADAATRAEIRITLTAALQEEIRKKLRWDRRKNGAQGRALCAAIPAAGLLAGDRLEQTAGVLEDVGEFERLTPPVEVVFWRRSRATVCTHRCPLWDPELGLGPSALAVDLLHSFHLGPVHNWAKHAIWELLSAGVWDLAEHPSAEERFLASLDHLRAELFAFYRSSDGESCTRVGKLTAKMLGSRDAPELKTKAMETLGLAMFLVHCLRRYKARLGSAGPVMLEAGEALLRLRELLSNAPAVVSDVHVQGWLDVYKRYLRLAQRLGIGVPKSHIMIHCQQRARRLGNPTLYSTFLDESLNATLKRTLRLCHQCRFEPLALFKINEVLRRGPLRQRAA